MCYMFIFGAKYVYVYFELIIYPNTLRVIMFKCLNTGVFHKANYTPF